MSDKTSSAGLESTPCGRGPDSDACAGFDCGLEARQVAQLRAEVQQLRQWGQQIHDALDGRPLPECPGEAPVRIEQLRAAIGKLRGLSDMPLAHRIADEALAPRRVHPARQQRAESATSG